MKLKLSCHKDEFPIIDYFLFFQEFDEKYDLTVELTIIETGETYVYSIKEFNNKWLFVTNSNF